jgi:hypothetical protein
MVGQKIPPPVDAVIGSEIRDPGWIKSGSGINIPDPQHWEVLYYLPGVLPGVDTSSRIKASFRRIQSWYLPILVSFDQTIVDLSVQYFLVVAYSGCLSRILIFPHLRLNNNKKE